jgi:Domain of unknown function (DUF5658)
MPLASIVPVSPVAPFPLVERRATGDPSPTLSAQLRGCLRDRRMRVILLLVACLAMSAADLAMTLTHAQTIGFAEANPLAREIMQMGSSLFITAWKLASVTISVGLLYLTRHTRSGELGAWLSLAILVWLMGRWSVYNQQVREFSCDLALSQTYSSHHWVKMDG